MVLWLSLAFCSFACELDGFSFPFGQRKHPGSPQHKAAVCTPQAVRVRPDRRCPLPGAGLGAVPGGRRMPSPGALLSSAGPGASSSGQRLGKSLRPPGTRIFWKTEGNQQPGETGRSQKGTQKVKDIFPVSFMPPCQTEWETVLS